jgi:chloramphenicol-sensitive protein RarD
MTLNNTASQADAAQSDAKSGVALGLGAYFIWGLVTIFWKHLKDFDSFELIGWRITTSAILLIVYMTATKRIKPLLSTMRNPTMLLRLTLASILLTINWTTYVWAVVNGHVIETALGYFIAPLCTMVLGVFILHEKLRRTQLVAVCFAVCGVVVLTVGYGRVPWIALTIASSWTFYGFLKKQVQLPPLESLTGEVIVACIPALAYVAVCWNHVDSVANTASPTEWTLIALTGFITTVPLLLFAASSQRIPLTLIGPMQYIVPTINFLLGWLLYSEEITATKVVGFALIWACLAIVLLDLFIWQQGAVQHRQQSASDQQ